MQPRDLLASTESLAVRSGCAAVGDKVACRHTVWNKCRHCAPQSGNQLHTIVAGTPEGDIAIDL